jgi:release factor glutamine methyltransferase
MTTDLRDDLVGRLRAAGCVFAENEADVLLGAVSAPAELETMVARRVGGEPLEHIVGWAEFAGLRIAVGPGVFVPRRRTEFLVRQAAAIARPGAVVVDLCCGSGAVGTALLASIADPELYAVEIDPVMVTFARRNIGAAGQVFAGDLFTPLPVSLRGRVDVLVANAPYVPTDSIALMPPEARDHEPQIALDGGADGLDVHRQIVAEAADWLSPSGRLLIEVSEQQAPIAVELFAANGLIPRSTHSDELAATVVIGRQPGR